GRARAVGTAARAAAGVGGVQGRADGRIRGRAPRPGVATRADPVAGRCARGQSAIVRGRFGGWSLVLVPSVIPAQAGIALRATSWLLVHGNGYAETTRCPPLGKLEERHAVCGCHK